MRKLDELFNRIQMRQATGKAIREVKDQLVQQAARMEEVHKELADALVKGGLMDMMQEFKLRAHPAVQGKGHQDQEEKTGT